MRTVLATPPERPYVVFDLETTGFRTPGDEIVEIAAVKCDKQGTILDTYEELVHPNCRIGLNAIQVHGITEAMVANSPTIDQVFPQFMNFIDNLPLVGHNIRTFDLRFLDTVCNQQGYQPIENPVFDTLPFARAQLGKGVPCGVEALIGRFGLESLPAHRALSDSLMENDVFLALRSMYKKKQQEQEQTSLFSVADKKKLRPKVEAGVYVHMNEALPLVEVKGFVPMKDIVSSYNFLRWTKRGSHWFIQINGREQDKINILQREVERLGHKMYIDRGNER